MFLFRLDAGEAGRRSLGDVSSAKLILFVKRSGLCLIVSFQMVSNPRKVPFLVLIFRARRAVGWICFVCGNVELGCPSVFAGTNLLGNQARNGDIL